MWLRKIILEWIFKYRLPLYFEATLYYKNIQWDIKDKLLYEGSNTFVSEKVIGDYGLTLWKEKGNKDRWTLNCNSGGFPQDTEFISSFEIMILRLHDIIHFGIIKHENQ